MRFKFAVRSLDNRLRARGRLQHQHGVHLLAGIGFRSNHGGLPYARRPVQHAFHIFRIHVETARRDDHFLFATQNLQALFGVEFAEIPRV